MPASNESEMPTEVDVMVEEEVYFRASHESIIASVKPLRRLSSVTSSKDVAGEKKKSKVLKDVTNSLLGKSGISKPSWVGNKGALENLRKVGGADWAKRIASGPKEVEGTTVSQGSPQSGLQQPMIHNLNQHKSGDVGGNPSETA